MLYEVITGAVRPYGEPSSPWQRELLRRLSLKRIAFSMGKSQIFQDQDRMAALGVVLWGGAVQHARCYSHGSQESDEEFDARWVTYFNKPDIDAWELRKGVNTLVGYDLVPEPKIIDAALRACRRLNDFASAVRILEVVKDKAGPHKEIYPYVIQELRPTLSELGISTPEELGLDKA
uniref:Cytochrome c oxidase subunit 5A, mitochondrial n=1 Tax=Meleagris gallopavo TaxID=9103 RepID=G1MTQ8_MELGA